jgi:hypothetical protein
MYVCDKQDGWCRSTYTAEPFLVFFPQQVQETSLFLKAAGPTLHVQGILRAVSLELSWASVELSLASRTDVKNAWRFTSSVPLPMAMRYTAYVCSRLIAEIVGSNPAEGMDVRLLCL